ncbi:hypothetical protein MXE23_14910, partial [Legionella pneumophila]|nr:hypothetical protein [Legionella pneumophila]
MNVWLPRYFVISLFSNLFLIVNSRIAFNTITDGISKVKADRQTVISVQNSLQSTEAQFEVGTRTMVD